MPITTVFIDRDGVINRDSPDYIKTVDEFHFLPDSPEAFALLKARGLSAMVITNQSIIGRGWVTPETLSAIFKKMTKGIEKAGGSVDDIFFCPHTPDDGCPCRKPKPGLIMEACRTHDINPTTSVMIGDSAKDVLCGKAAGCAATVLVRSGNAEKALADLAAAGQHPDHVADTLFDAVRWVIDTLIS
ncbi:D-glycero-beta-D-manno-heptose 1,7-bisphosphate 7-phosphatase [Desulfoluna spongiiphila]|uniref:D,D-heptose 1,7-bisphosphate phosphatase n=1 Tax=Desulfoluna spongiiphila TaxID=419481 RepID=A0A1G5CYQ7_9BACT|nr:D-glycero-beta-D-manno-heptose 1,7-bisphosphate 7-phosphatase [Desulfoluna spongiiphila]SCY07532.1 D-alpha,beta-D-heptose 1,7-bisphosphate phosphatase [Desulfoluna spongiiphila]VVS92487.1 d d-heptose 1 7-bisphosphate phosphatase [Desulfoluna spongiiphila]